MNNLCLVKKFFLMKEIFFLLQKNSFLVLRKLFFLISKNLTASASLLLRQILYNGDMPWHLLTAEVNFECWGLG